MNFNTTVIVTPDGKKPLEDLNDRLVDLSFKKWKERYDY